jgi:hypothetical protein
VFGRGPFFLEFRELIESAVKGALMGGDVSQQAVQLFGFAEEGCGDGGVGLGGVGRPLGQDGGFNTAGALEPPGRRGEFFEQNALNFGCRRVEAQQVLTLGVILGRIFARRRSAPRSGRGEGRSRTRRSCRTR